MPKAIKARLGVEKPAELLEAEKVGQEMLHRYCRAKQGNQAQLARATELLPATVSKMCSGMTAINLEAALLFEAATGGHLQADKLCPSRAELIAQILALRANKAAE